MVLYVTDLVVINRFLADLIRIVTTENVRLSLEYQTTCAIYVSSIAILKLSSKFISTSTMNHNWLVVGIACTQHQHMIDFNW